jgi:hypothetical protein
VIHVYNASYSKGRDQEDRSSKPAWADSPRDPISKKKKKKKSHTHKKRLVEWLKAWALSSNPSTATNKQTKEPPH